MIKNLPAMPETQVRSLSWDDPQEKGIANHFSILKSSLVAQTVKCLPTMWETWVQSLGQEDLLEKEMATHSILAWKIPWTEEPVRLQSMGVAKTRTRLSNFIHSLTHLELREWTRRFFKDHSCKCILIYCVLSCDKNKWDHQKSLLIETSMFKEVLYWKKRNQDISNIIFIFTGIRSHLIRIFLIFLERDNGAELFEDPL